MSNTVWTPRIPKSSTTAIYRAIADALENDVSEGTLREGSRLPTHRELADRLGVTPLTITRAYKEAARRGLIDSTVGRGTFVRSLRSEERPARQANALLDLSKNVVQGSDILELDGRTLGEVRALVRDPEYLDPAGSPRHRAAAAAWLRQRWAMEIDASRIIITPGAQQAILTALAALCRPGDTILAEELTYPRLVSMGAFLDLKVHPIALDAEGADPRALERALRRHQAKAFYTIPTFQNPTAAVMSLGRRRDIVSVARKHRLTIIEDDVYGFLLDETPACIASLYPEGTIAINSASKSLSPSLRLGFAAVPPELVERFTSSFAATTAFTSSVAAEIFTLLIESGSAEETVKNKRELVKRNRRIAERALIGQGASTLRATIHGHPMTPHLWITLPDDCDARELSDRVRQRGLAVSHASAFAVDRSSSGNGIRISIAATSDSKQLETALRTLGALVNDPRLGVATVV
jgi:DNA-binding transcriptional MocR family regulator